MAWATTALGATAVERFGADDDESAVVALAVVLMVMGVAVRAMDTRRYFTVARDLDRGEFRVDRRSPWVILVGASALAIVSLVVFIL